MRRSGGVSNEVIESRVQSRLQAMHRERLRTARPLVHDAPPARFAHLDSQTKGPARETVNRDRAIARQNSLLVNKMVSIIGRKPKPNHDPVLLTKAAHATVEDAYRPGPIPLPKSLNKDQRTRQLENIVLENEKFLNRLIASPGVYSRRQWDKQFENEVKYMESICRFPYADPSAIMPQVNPVLAIAQAQSNKSAEFIIKQQQAVLLAQAQAPNQFLPPVPGSAGFNQTSNNFGSTFGSTTNSIPPYPSSSLPPVHGNIPNHFPMPPPTAQSSSPPSTAGMFRPAPPNSSRPATSIATPNGVKLRAQWTSEGVRIIKTGRSRPDTSLSGARSGTASGARTPKYQPLRQQQALHTPAPPKKGQEEQKTNEAAPNASVENAANGEESSAATRADGAPTKSADAAANASTSDPTAAHESDANATPPEGYYVKLFEDTLVISNRPSLVRIFEAGGAHRLEIKVFDPWSQLEYNLSLPFAYIRLCFYQVTDLLLPVNRPYLLQTLLHYLVFAPSADGSGAVELLVDIVAPPPRNEAEQHAFMLAQDYAMLEQAKSDLNKEKEEAKAAHEQQHQLEEQQLPQNEREQHQQQHETTTTAGRNPPAEAASSSASVSPSSPQMASVKVAPEEAVFVISRNPNPPTSEEATFPTAPTSSQPANHTIVVTSEIAAAADASNAAPTEGSSATDATAADASVPAAQSVAVVESTISESKPAVDTNTTSAEAAVSPSSADETTTSL